MLNATRMKRVSEDASALLKALSHPTRLMILCQLAEGEKSVGALARLTGSAETTISQHLAILRREKLVSTRRDNQTIFYSLTSGPARNVLDALYNSFCAPNSKSR